MIVRTFWRAAKVENAQSPYDTIHLRVFYPAQMSESDIERNEGIFPADPQQAPFPVVIFFNGINCGIQIYQWLATELVKHGLVVVMFSWVAENLPGLISLTPGVDLHILQPGQYGTKPTASALPTVLAELERIQSQGILASLLDLQKIILGGHSAGGRVALESADPRFFPQVVAAFGYGVHSAAPMMLGYEPSTILPLPDSLPMLLMGGTCDGVIANSSDRYGLCSQDATTLTIHTFQEALKGGRGDNYLMLIEGANHFAIAYPKDPTTSRDFLDYPATQPEAEIRSLMAQTIGLFIDADVRHKASASQSLDKLLNTRHPLISCFERK